MRSLIVIPFWAEAGIFRHNSILAVWSLWTANCRFFFCKRDEKSPDNKGRRLVRSRGLSKIQMQTMVFFGDLIVKWFRWYWHLRLLWLASVTRLMELRTTTAFLRNKTEEGEFRRRKSEMTRMVERPFAADQSRDTKTSCWDARDALEQDKKRKLPFCIMRANFFLLSFCVPTWRFCTTWLISCKQSVYFSEFCFLVL